MLKKITEFSFTHPKPVTYVLVLVTMFFALQFPKIKTDTDPKNMLPATSSVRVYNDKVDELFELHPDVLALGIVNEKGIFNRGTLQLLSELTEEIKEINGVIPEDVTSLTESSNVLEEKETLVVKPAVSEIPQTIEEMEKLKSSLTQNPLFSGRLVSYDGTATVIYIPITKQADGKKIASTISKMLPKEREEKFYLAGDPVARDTFGSDMFLQMGIFSPIAGMVMFLVLWLMFRNFTLIAANMGTACMSIIWSMGAFIGLGVPVHIMSSMAPVFLMAISTDTVHIFNEFYFRLRETKNRREAVLQTMNAVARPILFTDLTTAAGFASLATESIIPVKVFGLMVACGTLVILLMSFTFVPAVLALISEEKLSSMTSENENASQGNFLSSCATFSIARRKAILLVAGIFLVVSFLGIKKIHVNNNMAAWFKKGSPVREADAVLNKKLAGTASGYIVSVAEHEDEIKNPENLKAIERLQRELETLTEVGKTVSIADVLKRIHRVLHGDDPAYEIIPDSREVIAQYLFLLSMSAKPRDINNFVDPTFTEANMIVSLKTWDADSFEKVVEKAKAFEGSASLSFKPAGIAYFNSVWNKEVLYGMLRGFITGAVFVFILMTLSFRSVFWGGVATLPLLFTIAVIYGFVGFVRKDFDMPISVLSTLSLGLATDFAVHFVGRFQQRFEEVQNVRDALEWTVKRPGMGIMRNAFLFSAGFSTMIFSPLTPYITVGLFMAGIMLFSAAATLVMLPGIVIVTEKIWNRRKN